MKKILITLMVALMLPLTALGAAAMDGHGAMEHVVTPVTQFTPAQNPLYPVGAQVVIETDHMAGMQGAVGVISGAFDTTLYAIDFTTDGGEAVKNHRWVTAEEIEHALDREPAVGDEVTLGAGHMEGLDGAGQKAVIVQVVEGPAYMVDYDPVGGGERVVDHQWVAEFELKSAG